LMPSFLRCTFRRNLSASLSWRNRLVMSSSLMGIPVSSKILW
jgi:hypothetical protein